MISNGLPGARWVPPENFHITLRFVGEVDHDVAEDVHDALARIEAPECDIALNGLDWFGNKWKASNVYARVQKTDALVHLQRKVESAVVRTGLKPESRKFCPHVTLGRLRNTTLDEVAQYVRERHAPEPTRFTADHFVLYSSFLTPKGPIYQAAAEYPLQLVPEAVF
jgi:2'-5' RNA ligase